MGSPFPFGLKTRRRSRRSRDLGTHEKDRETVRRRLIPDGHVLVKVGRVPGLGWFRADVGDLYCSDNGRPGIDPESAIRLMLAGFLPGIVQDRRLKREAQFNRAIRGFVGCSWHEALPDHFSLTRIRQRWGGEQTHSAMEPIPFHQTLAVCVMAPDQPLARHDVITPGRLHGQNRIPLMHRHLVCTRLDQVLARAGVCPNLVAEVATGVSAITLARGGVAVICPFPRCASTNPIWRCGPSSRNALIARPLSSRPSGR